MCPQNSHREDSSDESRNFRSRTNPEHPLKVAEELLLCVTNLIREKALLQRRDCKGKPRHAAHSRSLAQRALPIRAEPGATGTRQGACTLPYSPARISPRWSTACLACV